MAVQEFTLTHEEASGKLIEEFFDVVARKMGVDPADPNVRYDCRRIEIATNIQSLIYEAYAQRYHVQFARAPESCRNEVTIALAQVGPKENAALPPYTIRLDDSFLVGAQPKVIIKDGRDCGGKVAG